MKYSKSYFGIIAILIIIVTIAYSYYSLVPHKISDKNTPKSDFSTARAMTHIKNMTEHYHFVGTPYHKKVRDYIIEELKKLNLKTEVQVQFSLNDKWRGATVNENILTRIKGKEKGKALMILSHYDSAPFASKGASDDAVGVATILEGIRAYLHTNQIPEHDIIILISDGEEIGLVGAKAFVEHHPWAKDVGLVINFEARGSGGPSYTLMETNGGNANMVKEFTKANPNFPVANSFLYSIYKMLPNDTDLTMFREIADIDGYNFAFIDDFYDYHCITDNYNNVDINTVEHQGDYLMTLLNYFSKKDFDNIKSDKDYVFFNFPIIKMVYYPFSWVKYMFYVLVILFLILVFMGINSNKIRVINIFKGFIPLVLSIGSSVILTIYGWKLILIIHPGYTDILQGFPYNGHYYILAFVLFAIGLTIWVYRKFFDKLNLLELLIAPILFWIIIIGAFAFYLKGASFMIIPVYIALIVMLIELFFSLNKSIKLILYAIASIPGLLIIAPFIDMFPVGLKMVSMPISVLFAILLLSLSFPVIKNISFRKTFTFQILLFSLIFLVIAEFNSGFGNTGPKPNSINYIYYADDNQAYWETYSKVSDSWLDEIMGENKKNGSFGKSDIMSKFNTITTFHSKAKSIDLPQPIITRPQDLIINGTRYVELIIKPQRKVNRIELITTEDIEFERFEVNGEAYSKSHLVFTDENSRILTYYFTRPDEVMKIKFRVDPYFKPRFLLYEASYNLIGNGLLNVPKRPENIVPMPFVLNDAIVTVKKIEL